MAEALDHVGIAGADLTVLAESFERLGFTLTKPARHAGHATGNRCIMLSEGYLELIAVVDPAGSSPTLAAMLARYAGAHIIALAVRDAAACLPRLKRAGLADAEVVEGAREEVRFATVGMSDTPEGRLLLIQHLTPEALRPARVLGHANRAAALQEVVIASAAPAETAARLSRLAGLPVQPDPLGGFMLKIAQASVRVLTPASVEALFPGAVAPALPWIAGVTISTDDGNAAIRRRLAYYNIPHRPIADILVVEAGGAFLQFRGAAWAA